MRDDSNKTFKLDNWHRGSPTTAKHFQQSHDAIKTLVGGLALPRQVAQVFKAKAGKAGPEGSSSTILDGILYVTNKFVTSTTVVTGFPQLVGDRWEVRAGPVGDIPGADIGIMPGLNRDSFTSFMISFGGYTPGQVIVVPPSKLVTGKTLRINGPFSGVSVQRVGLF